MLQEDSLIQIRVVSVFILGAASLGKRRGSWEGQPASQPYRRIPISNPHAARWGPVLDVVVYLMS